MFKKKRRLLIGLGLLVLIGGSAYSIETVAAEDNTIPNITIKQEPLYDSSQPTQSPETKSILPNDDRNQITDTSRAPYQSICFIQVNNSIQASGVVVGKDAILTNRHVAEAATNGDPENIKIEVGKTNNSTNRGTFIGKEIRYIDNGQDLALIFTAPNSNNLNVGDVSTPANFVENPNTAIGTNIRVIGYPGDKPEGTMWESKGKSVWGAYTQKIFYDASTYSGNAGSPVFNDQNELIGINFGSVDGANVAERLDSQAYAFLLDNLDKTQSLDLGGQGVGGYSDNSHDSGFPRVVVNVRGHKASVAKTSDYQFHWSGWKTSKYASIKITDPNGNVLYNQAWNGNQPVEGKGSKKFGTFAQYDVPEGSSIEIYDAEGFGHRYYTNDNSELKTKLGHVGRTYIYKMKNNRLVLTNVK